MKSKRLLHCRVKNQYVTAMALFVLIVKLSSAWSSTKFVITDFGAKGDGKTLCTQTIQSAIDSCAKRGGGTVLVPPGRFLTGTVILKDNVFLEITSGATILGSTDINDYQPKVLIYAKDAMNIGIIGPGIIDGQGDYFWRHKLRPYNRPGRTVEFYRCENAIIQNVSIRNSAAFNIAVESCDRVIITGVNIINDREAPNTDGIDPISSSNVFISNCYIETGDDAICPKSHRVDKPCENLVVTNCVLISDDSAIKFGTASMGAIRHCIFNNIVIRNTQYGIGFYMKDGGSFEDIQFSNISIETAKQDLSRSDRGTNSYPIFMDIEKRDNNSRLGTIRNVMFRGINITTVDGNCLISGMPEKQIHDLTFSNIRMRVTNRSDLSGRHKPRGTRTLKSIAPNDMAHISSHFTFSHIDGLKIRNLVIEDETKHQNFERHSLWALDVQNVNIDGFHQHQIVDNEDLSLCKFTEVSNVLIRGCTPVSPNTPFLELVGTSTSDVSLLANDLSKVKTPVKLSDGASKKSVFKEGNRER